MRNERDSQAPYRDGKRVLECLQKALRIATSSIDELTSVQLYCDALDQYLYYFERGVEAVSSPFLSFKIRVNSPQTSTHSIPTHPSSRSRQNTSTRSSNSSLRTSIPFPPLPLLSATNLNLPRLNSNATLLRPRVRLQV